MDTTHIMEEDNTLVKVDSESESEVILGNCGQADVMIDSRPGKVTGNWIVVANECWLYIQQENCTISAANFVAAGSPFFHGLKDSTVIRKKSHFNMFLKFCKASERLPKWENDNRARWHINDVAAFYMAKTAEAWDIGRTAGKVTTKQSLQNEISSVSQALIIYDRLAALPYGYSALHMLQKLIFNSVSSREVEQAIPINREGYEKLAGVQKKLMAVWIASGTRHKTFSKMTKDDAKEIKSKGILRLCDLKTDNDDSLDIVNNWKCICDGATDVTLAHCPACLMEKAEWKWPKKVINMALKAGGWSKHSPRRTLAIGIQVMNESKIVSIQEEVILKHFTWTSIKQFYKYRKGWENFNLEDLPEPAIRTAHMLSRLGKPSVEFSFSGLILEDPDSPDEKEENGTKVINSSINSAIMEVYKVAEKSNSKKVETTCTEVRKGKAMKKLKGKKDTTLPGTSSSNVINITPYDTLPSSKKKGKKGKGKHSGKENCDKLLLS